MQINSVIIVGGGTSGWFTASALCKLCPEIDITLVESPNVPTIGVGESTLGHINLFFNSLGMDENEWMPHCDATYKASIKFTDFYKPGEYFHYPFGYEDRSHAVYGKDDWFFKKWIYPDTPSTDFASSYTAQMPLIERNKIYLNEDNAIPFFDPERDFAYQMDAIKLGNWMRDNLCLPTGMTHILGEISNVHLDTNGWISSISTEDDITLKADLYIDCTGFKSRLLGESLKVPYISYDDLLINNNAWATKVPYTDPNTEMEMVTNCTAIENGWVWNIPLWSRIGSGYVYSDKFTDKDSALKEFKKHLNCSEELEFKHIEIKNGRYEKSWVDNCIAIGLSNGFVEPLESTGLLLTHETINKLVITLQSKDRCVNRLDKESLNREVAAITDTFKYFVALHFAGSERTDTEYWRWYTQELELPEEFYKYSTDLDQHRLQHHTVGGLDLGTQCIMVGHHMNLYTDYIRDRIAFSNPDWEHTNKETFNKELHNVFKYWRRRTARIEKLADKCPTMYEYLKENIYK